MDNTTQQPFFSSGSEQEKKILEIYQDYRKKFISYMMYHHTIDEDALKDIYHDSFLLLVEKIQSGEVIKNFKTFLYTTGYYKMLKYFAQQRKNPNLAPEQQSEIMDTDETIDPNEKEKHRIACQLVKEIGDPCKTVLNLYYWQKKSMREIAIIMNYQNEQVAKNRKSKCIKTLKELLREQFRKKELL